MLSHGVNIINFHAGRKCLVWSSHQEYKFPGILTIMHSNWWSFRPPSDNHRKHAALLCMYQIENYWQSFFQRLCFVAFPRIAVVTIQLDLNHISKVHKCESHLNEQWFRSCFSKIKLMQNTKQYGPFSFPFTKSVFRIFCDSQNIGCI